MAVVRTLTTHVKLLGVGIGAAVLFGGTATTISLADSSTPTPPTTHPAPQANPHATAAKKADKDDAEGKDEPSGVRPTDTHGYCVSHAVAAAKAHGATGQDIAKAAHSCHSPGKSGTHGNSAAAPGHHKS